MKIPAGKGGYLEAQHCGVLMGNGVGGYVVHGNSSGWWDMRITAWLTTPEVEPSYKSEGLVGVV
ncbi:hypothetical protein [Streptomyces sp. NPDC088766]|uniref:hypothetical protein n=1 Tax=Streptomyces sp. NPDC088766 TaxID=3365893 RepID=UPI0038103E03